MKYLLTFNQYLHKIWIQSINLYKKLFHLLMDELGQQKVLLCVGWRSDGHTQKPNTSSTGQ